MKDREICSLFWLGPCRVSAMRSSQDFLKSLFWVPLQIIFNFRCLATKVMSKILFTLRSHEIFLYVVSRWRPRLSNAYDGPESGMLPDSLYIYFLCTKLNVMLRMSQSNIFYSILPLYTDKRSICSFVWIVQIRGVIVNSGWINPVAWEMRILWKHSSTQPVARVKWKLVTSLSHELCI